MVLIFRNSIPEVIYFAVGEALHMKQSHLLITYNLCSKLEKSILYLIRAIVEKQRSYNEKENSILFTHIYKLLQLLQEFHRFAKQREPLFMYDSSFTYRKTAAVEENPFYHDIVHALNVILMKLQQLPVHKQTDHIRDNLTVMLQHHMANHVERSLPLTQTADHNMTLIQTNKDDKQDESNKIETNDLLAAPASIPSTQVMSIPTEVTVTPNIPAQIKTFKVTGQTEGENAHAVSFFSLNVDKNESKPNKQFIKNKVIHSPPLQSMMKSCIEVKVGNMVYKHQMNNKS